MVFQSDYGGIAELDKDVPYDLRQVYAVEILGASFKDVMDSRKKDNYSAYFKALKDLYIVLKHKIQAKKKEVYEEDGGKEKKNYAVLFEASMKAAALIARKYPDAWLGSDKDSEKCAEIEAALNEMEMILYEGAEEAKLFGGSNRIIGL